MVNIAQLLAVKLLAIDRGNSRTKVGISNQDEAPEIYYFANADESGLVNLLKEKNCDAGAMSSVAANNLPLIAEYFQKKTNYFLIDAKTPIPLKNEYATPNTLGADRIAGAVGAWTIAGKKDVLLLDAGTCINYECVLDNTYKGGAIAPGLEMRLRAMHEFTGKLPQLELTEALIELTGDSTSNCMLSGCVWGMVHEMNGIAETYKSRYPSIRVILTGGDAAYLGKYLKNSIFAPHKEVVIVGLLEILKHQLNA
jgi:type III pantothenate kinase